MKIGYVPTINSAIEFQQVIKEMSNVDVDVKNIFINLNFSEFAATLTSGDVIVVQSLEPFSSVSELLTQTIYLLKQNITIESINEPWFEVTPQQMELLQGIKDMERKLRCIRTKQGLKNAIASGKKLGRPVGTTQCNKKVEEVRRLCKSEGLSITKACKVVGCQTRTYYRHLEKAATKTHLKAAFN